MIGRRMKTTPDSFKSVLVTCFQPSSTQPSAAQSSLPSSLRWSWVKKGGLRDQWSDMRSRFLFVTLATWSCSEPDKFYGLRHIWYNVVMAYLASFPRFVFLRSFFMPICKIEASRIWLNRPSLWSGTSHNIYQPKMGHRGRRVGFLRIVRKSTYHLSTLSVDECRPRTYSSPN